LLNLAEREADTIMPGYPPANCAAVDFWAIICLAWYENLLVRDGERLAGLS